MHVNPNLPIHSISPSPLRIHTLVLYFCFAKKFIRIIFSGFKVWYIHTMEYCSAMKKERDCAIYRAVDEPRDYHMTKISQREKNTWVSSPQIQHCVPLRSLICCEVDIHLVLPGTLQWPSGR